MCQKLLCGKEVSSFVLPLSVISDNDSCVASSLKNTIAVVQKANGSSAFLYELVMKDFKRRKEAAHLKKDLNQTAAAASLTKGE